MQWYIYVFGGKKFVILFVFIVLFMSGCKGKDSSKGITGTYISTYYWSGNSHEYHDELELNSDGTYELFREDFSTVSNGTYKIDGDKISIDYNAGYSVVRYQGVISDDTIEFDTYELSFAHPFVKV